MINLGLKIDGDSAGLVDSAQRGERAVDSLSARFEKIREAFRGTQSEAAATGEAIGSVAANSDSFDEMSANIREMTAAIKEQQAASSGIIATFQKYTSLISTFTVGVSNGLRIVQFFSDQRGKFEQTFSSARDGAREAATEVRKYFEAFRRSAAVQQLGEQARVASAAAKEGFTGAASAVGNLGAQAASAVGSLARFVVPLAAIALVVAPILLVVAAFKLLSSVVGLLIGQNSDLLRSSIADHFAEQAKAAKDFADAMGLAVSATSVLQVALAKAGGSLEQWRSGTEGIRDAILENAEGLEEWIGPLQSASGEMLTQQQIAEKLAEVLEQYDEQSQKAILSEIGMATSLKDLQQVAGATAEKMREAAQEQAKFGLIMDKEGVESAKRYTDSLREFKRQSELTWDGLKATIARAVMPVLADLAEYFKGAWPRAVEAFRNWVVVAMLKFYDFVGSVLRLVDTFGVLVSAAGVTGRALAEVWGAVKTGNFSAIAGIVTSARDVMRGLFQEVEREAKKREEGYVQRVKNILTGGTNAAAAVDLSNNKKTYRTAKGNEEESGTGRGDTEALLNARRAFIKAIIDLETAAADAIRSIRADALDGELADLQRSFAARRLTEEQYINATADLQRAKNSLALEGLEEQRRAIAKQISELTTEFSKTDPANEKQRLDIRTRITAELQRYAKVLADVQKIEAATSDITKKQAADQERLARAKRDFQEDLNRQVLEYQESLEAAAREREFEIDLIGKTTQEQSKLRAERQAQLEVDRLILEARRLESQLAAATRDGDADRIKALNAQLLAMYAKIAAAQAEVAKAGADAQVRAQREAQQTIVDGWIQSAGAIKDALVDSIVEWVTRGKIEAANLRRAIVDNLANMFIRSPLQAIFQAASNPGSVGGFSGILNAFQTAGSNFSTTISNAAANFGSLLQQSSIPMIQSLGSMISGASGMMGQLGLIGASIAASFGLAKTISNGYKIEGGLGKVVNILGPLTGIFGGVVTGIINRLFGRKLQDAGFEAQYANGGITGSDYQFFKGGFFRSDKTVRSDLDPEVASVLNKGTSSIISQFQGYAAALKLGSEALDSFTFNFKLSTKDLKPEQIQAELEKQFSGFAKGALEKLFAGTELQRAVGEISGTAQEMDQAVRGLIELKLQLDGLREVVPDLALSFDAFRLATAEQRETLLTLGTALQLSTTSAIESAIQSVVAAGSTTLELLNSQGTIVQQLAQSFDGSLIKAKALAAAEVTRLQLLQQLIAQIGQIKASIKEQFGADAAGFRLAALDKDQQYGFYDQQAKAALDAIRNAIDPQVIEREAARYRNAVQSAFSLLSPDQQRAQGNTYGDLVDGAESLIQERLSAAQEKAQSEAKALGDQIKASIEAAMQKVADKMGEAADKMVQAADKPVQVVVRSIVEVEPPQAARVESEVFTDSLRN